MSELDNARVRRNAVSRGHSLCGLHTYAAGPFMCGLAMGSDRLSSFQLGGGWCISGVPNVRLLPYCTVERSSYLSGAFL